MAFSVRVLAMILISASPQVEVFKWARQTKAEAPGFFKGARQTGLAMPEYSGLTNFQKGY